MPRAILAAIDVWDSWQVTVSYTTIFQEGKVLKAIWQYE